jgi:hypothetical protein
MPRSLHLDLAGRLAGQWLELWLAAPQVIGLRALQMATPAWTATAQRALATEMHRMGSEKIAAAMESAIAATMQLGQWQTRVALQAWRAALRAPSAPVRMRVPAMAPVAAAASLQRIASRAHVPVHRRVTANARRLRKQLRDG